MNINIVEVIGMLENIDELLRIYEVMKKDLYTLLVTKSPYILDYEGSNDRGKTITKLVEFRYRTNFKDSDHTLTFKVQRYLKSASCMFLSCYCINQNSHCESIIICEYFRDTKFINIFVTIAL